MKFSFYLCQETVFLLHVSNFKELSIKCVTYEIKIGDDCFKDLCNWDMKMFSLLGAKCHFRNTAIAHNVWEFLFWIAFWSDLLIVMTKHLFWRHFGGQSFPALPTSPPHQMCEWSGTGLPTSPSHLWISLRNFHWGRLEQKNHPAETCWTFSPTKVRNRMTWLLLYAAKLWGNLWCRNR